MCVAFKRETAQKGFGIEEAVRKAAYEREGAFQEALRLRNDSWIALQAD